MSSNLIARSSLDSVNKHLDKAAFGRPFCWHHVLPFLFCLDGQQIEVKHCCRAISESTKAANVAKLSELLHAIVVEQNPRIPSKLFTDCKYIVEGMDLPGIVAQHHHDAKEGYHKPLAQPVWSDIDKPYLGTNPKKASAIVRSGFNKQVVPKWDVMITFVQDCPASTRMEQFGLIA